MSVLVVDNGGGGFAERVDTEDGETVGEVVRRFINGHDTEEYLIRVNGSIAERSRVLSEDDRITITPKGVKGAL